MNTGESIGSGENIDGHEHGHHHHRYQIHFTVDREPVEVLSGNRDETELKVREILDISGNKPASDFWLVEYVGEGHKDRLEYKDLDQKIKVKNHARYSAVCEKPTPVS